MKLYTGSFRSNAYGDDVKGFIDIYMKDGVPNSVRFRFTGSYNRDSMINFNVKGTYALFSGTHLKQYFMMSILHREDDTYEGIYKTLNPDDCGTFKIVKKR